MTPSASLTSVAPSLLSPIAGDGSKWDEEKGKRAGRRRSTGNGNRPLKREMGFVRWGRRRDSGSLNLVLEELEGEESSWKEELISDDQDQSLQYRMCLLPPLSGQGLPSGS